MDISHMTVQRSVSYRIAVDNIASICNISSLVLAELLGKRSMSLTIRLSKLPDTEIIDIVNKVKSGTPLRKLLPTKTVTIMLVLKKDVHTKLKEKGYIHLLPAILEDIANHEPKPKGSVIPETEKQERKVSSLTETQRRNFEESMRRNHELMIDLAKM